MELVVALLIVALVFWLVQQVTTLLAIKQPYANVILVVTLFLLIIWLLTGHLGLPVLK